MDVFQSENVKLPNSLLVGWLTGGEEDNDIFEYLGILGSINRTIKITSDEPQFKDTAIVEFTSGAPIQFLREKLPCQRPSSNPDVIHQLQLLSELYAADKYSSLTHSYLAELQGIANLSGTAFEKLLLDELAKIQRSTKKKPTPEPNIAVATQDSQATNDESRFEPLPPETQLLLQIDTDLPNLHEFDSRPVTVNAET